MPCRFFAIFVSSVDFRKPHLIELAVQLTSSMKAAQCCLTELIGLCVQELKRCQIPCLVDQESELTLDMALLPWFEDKLRRRLEHYYFNEKIPDKIKRLLDDIGRLRQLMNNLETEDGRSIVENLEAIRSKNFGRKKKTIVLLLRYCFLFLTKIIISENPLEYNENSGWLFTSTADKLYETCKKRIHESPTKWGVLKTILKELAAEIIEGRLELLIVGYDENVCQRLNHLCLQDNLISGA